MPLMKYFGFVGSALVLLLLAMNWLLPGPASEPVNTSIERPVIRISSMEILPERVVFDTNLPRAAPPPSAIRVAVQPSQSAFIFEQITPGVLATFSTVAHVVPKKPIIAKRDPPKIVSTPRAASPAHTAAAGNYAVREAELNSKPAVKPTVLDDIAGRVGQIFKVN